MTVLDLLRRTAARHAADRGIEFEDRRFTFADLEGGSNGAARVLRAHGVGKGDRVVLCGEASLEWILGYLGALKLGARVVPVNPAYRRNELAWIVTDATPKAIVADRSRVADCGAVAGDAALLAIERGDGPAPERRAYPFYEALKKASVTPVDELVFDRDEALIVYTSGTTGKPKGAVLTHGNLVANTRATTAAFAWTDEDRLLLTLPLFHVHGLCVGLHGALLTGCDTRLTARFDRDAVLRDLARWRATLFLGVPTMYARLADAAGDAGITLPSARLFVSGSAPLPSAVARRFEERLGHAPLERYGMTETLITLAQPIDGPRRAGSVGWPVDGIEARVVDDRGTPVDDGVEGELQVRGTSVGPRYWNNEEASLDSRTDDGWFRTGDVAVRDPGDGQYSIVGRARELIISGGYNVYPREVEDALCEHEDVVEAMVHGVADDDLGEAVAAQVVSRAPLTADDLIGFVEERLASFKKPRRIEFVDALPRNAMGKVLRPDRA